MSSGLNWFIDLSGEEHALIVSDEEEPAPLLRPGEQLAGRYELLEQLGEGGMGVVYRARELSSGRTVAIKLISGRLSDTHTERMRREGIVTAAVRHPGVVSIHAAGAVDGAPYLVYEYVPGGRTLGHLLDEGAPRDVLLTALRDAAEALGAVHAAGAVHRDVKPENLLVGDDGRVRVADFGLARGLGMESLTKSGEVLGTPLYTSPEQFDSSRKVGPASDVWSLGVVLYQVLTGELPFHGGNLVELLVSVREAPLALHAHAPDLEPDLAAICKRALERDLSRRYPDGAAMAADLTRFLAGEAIRDRPSRAGWFPAAVTVSLLLLLCAVVLVGGPKPEQLRRALAEHRSGGADLAAVERALLAHPEAEAHLRAEAHELLATGTSGTLAEWEARLGHAETAADLDPARAPAAAHLRARALLELGRYGEAVVAWREAPPGAQVEGLELLVACARWEEARALLPAARLADPRHPRLPFLEAAARVGAGAEDLEAWRSNLPAGAFAVLESWHGGDPLGPLLRRVAFPLDPEVLEALVRAHLERGEVAEARAALARLMRPPPHLKETLAVLAAQDVAPLERLSRPWKLVVGRCVAIRARRELDLARLTEDPRFETGPGALAPEARRARAEACLAFLRSELPGETFAPPRAVASATEALREARELREQGKPSRAQIVLERIARSTDYDLGSYAAFSEEVAAVAAALPEEAEDLRALAVVPPPVHLPRVTGNYESTPGEVAPHDWNGLYCMAAADLRTEPERCLRAMVLAVAHAPRLVENLRADLYVLGRSDALVGAKGTLRKLQGRFDGEGWLDRLARATLEAASVEFDRLSPTSVELDAFLDDYPGVVFARLLRVYVRVRAGRTLAAREDLAVIREVFPTDHPSTALAYTLVLAREGAPVAEVRSALETAHELGFTAGELWTGEELPELEPYRSDPRIEELIDREERRRRRQERRRNR